MISLFLFLLNCTNPFSTREPHPPATTKPTQAAFSLQSHPDSLLAKLQYAFDEKNRFYYRECLADSNRSDLDKHFQYVANLNERNRLIGWSLQDEINYFDKLSSDPEIESKTLQIYNKPLEWIPVGASQDSLQNRFSYEIELRFRLKKEYYRGQAIFRIVRSTQSLWYIYYWEDLELQTDQSDSTWSTLRANYR
ncbi:MAG: hypothetical protein Kow0042_29960 [Calditrichia bacterium]